MENMARKLNKEVQMNIDEMRNMIAYTLATYYEGDVLGAREFLIVLYGEDSIPIIDEELGIDSTFPKDIDD